MEDNFKNLNSLLNKISCGFIDENLDLIVSAINETNESFSLDFELLNKQDGSSTNKDEVINITRMFFYYIDSTGNLGLAFDNCLKNNKVYLWKPSEKKLLLEYYKSIGVINNNEDDIDYWFCSLYPTSVINGPLTGNVAQDVVSLVHEFLHYYSFGCDIEFARFTCSFLGEMLSIYFETRAANWLVSQGYNEDDAFYMLKIRRNTDCLNNSMNVGVISIRRLIDLIDIKKRDGLITIDNIVKDEDIWTLKDSSYFLKIAEIVLYGGTMPVIDEEEAISLKNDYVCSLNLKLSSLFDFSNGYFRKIISSISYTLGTYFANRSVDSKLDEKMLYIANNLSTTRDESKLISLLYDGDKFIKSKKNVF